MLESCKTFFLCPKSCCGELQEKKKKCATPERAAMRKSKRNHELPIQCPGIGGGNKALDAKKIWNYGCNWHFQPPFSQTHPFSKAGVICVAITTFCSVLYSVSEACPMNDMRIPHFCVRVHRLKCLHDCSQVMQSSIIETRSYHVVVSNESCQPVTCVSGHQVTSSSHTKQGQTHCGLR